jgi:steroid 5-alpha reductase family enzyme
VYVVQRVRRDAGVVDVGWAAGVGFSALFYAVAADGDPVRRTALAVLGGFWGLRLAGYLLLDRVMSDREDGRYAAMREAWGENAQRNLFLFFQAQAFWVALFSLPFLGVAANGAPFPGSMDIAGIVVWILSVAGEGVADAQLSRHRRNPSNLGKTCRSGLWRYSRHPNYFFEWLHWVAWGVLAVGSANGWVAFAVPAFLLVLLFRVTGIPETEAQSLRTRGEDYRRYQREVSVFVPLPPRRRRAEHS